MRHLTIVPCSESWEQMAPTADGSGARRCDTCERDVIDTTTLDHQQLHALAAAAQTRRICARLALIGDRPRTRLGLAAGLAVALAGCAPVSAPQAATAHEQSERSSLVGTVRDPDGQPLEHALIILQSTALPEVLDQMTSQRGVYAFPELPPGTYTIQVLKGKTDMSKVVVLPERGRLRVNFEVDPRDHVMGLMLLDEPSSLDTTSASSTMRVFMDERR